MGAGFCFWGFINGTFNATCRPIILDQEQFYLRHKRKQGYKYQVIVTSDGLASSLIGSFIGQRGNWKMVEESSLAAKLQAVNRGCQPIYALYLYGNPAYTTIYGIMGPYKNYLSHSCTLAQEQFNKIMSRLQIEVEYGFAIHQNLWTWNRFHLGLKVSQGLPVYYAISVFLVNIWICIRGNQTSIRFVCAPSALETDLKLLVDDHHLESD